MANILFTWEIGEGSGHIAPYIELIRQLEQDGHQVFFAARQLYHVFRLFKDTRVTFLQSPTLTSPSATLQNPVDSYAKILNNSGYYHPDSITGMIIAWKNLYNLVKPDLIIFDYSPTAMLAARSYPAKTLHMGSGFFCPADTSPIVGLNELQCLPQDQEELRRFEAFLLNNINLALANTGIPPLGKLGDMHLADKRLFFGFHELDHYRNRQDGQYIGMFKSPPGALPEWPSGNGPRIFAYTKPFATLPSLLETLNKNKWPTLIYPDGVSQQLIRRFSSPTLKFVNQRLDMQSLGKTADIAICNGNFGTTYEMLMAGIPMLLLPLHAEQHIGSINIERIGAGLCAKHRAPQGMAIKLQALASDPRFRAAARQFADTHHNFTHDHAMQASLAAIQTLLGHDAQPVADKVNT